MTRTCSSQESVNNYYVDWRELTDAELLKLAESAGTFSFLDEAEEDRGGEK